MPNAVILQAIVTILEELKAMDSLPGIVERDGAILSLRDVMDVLVQHGILLAELDRGRREASTEARARFNEIRVTHEQLRRELQEHQQEDRAQFARIERVLPNLIVVDPTPEAPKALPEENKNKDDDTP